MIFSSIFALLSLKKADDYSEVGVGWILMSMFEILFYASIWAMAVPFLK